MALCKHVWKVMRLCYVCWKLWKVVVDNAGDATAGHGKMPQQNFGY